MTELPEGFDDVIVLVRRGFEDVTYDRPLVPSRRSDRPPRWSGSPGRVAGLAFVATLLVAVPLVMARMAPPANGPGPASSPTGPPASADDPLVWPPPIPRTEAPADAPWRCPPLEEGGDRTVDPSSPDAPSDLRFSLPASVPAPDRSWIVVRSEACFRPPSLILVRRSQATDGERIEATVQVWVERSAAEGGPRGAVEPWPDPSLHIRDGFVVRPGGVGGDAPVWIEAAGVVDELPVMIEAAGIDEDELFGLIAAMRADPATGAVTLDGAGTFDVVHQGPVVATVVRPASWHAEWSVEGRPYDLEVWRDPGVVVGAPGCVAATPAGESIRCREGESVSVLWAPAPGLVARIGGTAGSDVPAFAAALAEGIRPIPPPELPTSPNVTAFSGETWQLVVGEAENPGTGSWKVCHAFGPRSRSDGNGFGPSGCVTWPDDRPEDGEVLVAAEVAYVTPGGVVLFVDLISELVDHVVVRLADGRSVDVVPFRLPGSGKGFVATEIPNHDGPVTIEVVGVDGTILAERMIPLRGEGG